MAVKFANVRLTFGGKQVLVTLSGDNNWKASGDPKQVLPEDEGSWEWKLSAGIEMYGTTEVLVVLAGWNFGKASVGESGEALLLPNVKEDLGEYYVTQVE